MNIHRRKRFVATGSVAFVVQNFGHLFECFALLYASWFPAQHFDFLDDVRSRLPIRFAWKLPCLFCGVIARSETTKQSPCIGARVHKCEIAAPSARNDKSFFAIGYFLSLIKKGPGLLQTLFNVAGTTRLELATFGVTGRRTNQLYYAPVKS